jgi:hypothetical protein
MIIRYQSCYALKDTATGRVHSSFLSLCLVFLGGTNGLDVHFLQHVNFLAISYFLTTYSVALIHKRTIPAQRPLLVGEISANFCA